MYIHIHACLTESAFDSRKVQKIREREKESWESSLDIVFVDVAHAPYVQSLEISSMQYFQCTRNF